MEKLNSEQVSALRSLYYWRYEAVLCRYENDESGLKQARRNIEWLLTLCDQRKISYRLQNSIMYESEKRENHNYRYFEDILKKVMAY